MSSASPIHPRLVGGAAALLLSIATANASEPLPDPTRPPASAQEEVVTPEQKPSGGLELRAIFHADDRRFAVIDGRRVEVSDEIGGARVLAIEVDRVRLEREGEIVELELVSPAFKNARRDDSSVSAPASPSESGTPDPQGAPR